MKAFSLIPLLLSATLLACSPAPSTPSPNPGASATPQPAASAPTASSGQIELKIDGKPVPVKSGFEARDVGGGDGMNYFFGESGDSAGKKGWSVSIITSWNAKKETSQLNFRFTETYSPAACPTCTAYAGYEATAFQFSGTSATRSVPAGASATAIAGEAYSVTFAGDATVKFPTETTHRFELKVGGLSLEPVQG